MRLAAYQPDIPQNVGALIRIAACFDTPLDVIGPCAFPFSTKDARRVAMDYADTADVKLYVDWETFYAGVASRDDRLVLLTTKADRTYTEFAFARNDVLLLGRESKGAPQHVHAVADARIRIPLAPAARSLNIAVAAAVALAEARRRLSIA